MSEQLKESLSAVMDGEADEFEIRRVLNETANDSELRGVWERYHLVRSVMRGEGRTRGARSFERAVLDADRCQRNAGRRCRRTGGREPGSRANELDPMGSARCRRCGRGGCRGRGDHRLSRRRSGEGATGAGCSRGAGGAGAIRSLCSTMKCVVDGVPAALDLQRAHAYMLHHAHHVALNNRSVVPFVKVAAFESTK